MAVLLLFPAVNFHRPQTQNRISIIDHRHHRRLCFRLNSLKHRQPFILSEKRSNSNEQDGEIDNLGVKAALSVLKFYKSGSGFDPPRWFDERSLPEDEQF